MRFGALILLACAMGCKGDDDGSATGDTGGPDTTPDPTDTELTTGERVQVILALTPNNANGKIIYESADRCSQCHLVSGAGGGPYPALTERVPTLDDARLAQVTIDGTPGTAGTKMPAYGDFLTDQEIRDVVGYIRTTFGGGAAAP